MSKALPGKTGKEIVLQYVPSEKQLKAHLCDEKIILFGGATSGGKSVWGVNDMLQSCIDFSKNRVGIFRWENTIFENSTFKTLKEWVLDVPGLVKSHNKTRRSIILFNDSEIFYGGLKPTSSSAGDILSTTKSLELSCCFLDEVSDFPEEVLIFLFGRIGRWHGIDNRTGKRVIVPKRLICSSNPVPGWVKKRWIDNQLEFHAFIPSMASDNPHLHPDHVSDLRKIWGPELAQKLLDGDWDAIEDHESLFSYATILEAASRNIEPSPNDEIIIACDVASFGDDETVIGMRKGLHSEIMETIKKSDTMFVADRLAWYNAIYHPEVVKVDGVGIGEGVCSRLDQLEVPCERFIAGAKAFDEEKFLNLRAECYWHLRELFNKGLIDIPDDTDLHGDLASIRYEIQGDRKVKIESKRDMKKRTGKSPDYADCFVMLYSDAVSPYQICTSV